MAAFTLSAVGSCRELPAVDVTMAVRAQVVGNGSLEISALVALCALHFQMLALQREFRHEVIELPRKCD